MRIPFRFRGSPRIRFTKRVLYYECLTDVDELVGRPFQEELAYETGIDSALEALDQVDSGGYNSCECFY
jgi:hypothetical protein